MKNDYKDIIWNYTKDTEWMEHLSKGLPPLIISVAITGGGVGAELNPNLPEIPERQAEETYKAYKAGASAVHVHARDPERGYATASRKSEHYFKVNKLIREACPDIIINNTTGGAYDFTPEEKIVSLFANPELCSISCGPLAFRGSLKKRTPPLSGRDKDVEIDTVVPLTFGETEWLAQKANEYNVKPELDVYHPGQYWLVNNLISKRLIAPPYMLHFDMGITSGIYPTPMALIEMIRGLPEDAMFMVAVLGAESSLALDIMGIILGGHVRVGIEDYPYYRAGELATSSAQLVERIVRLSHELGREIATPAQARRMYAISTKPSQYA